MDMEEWDTCLLRAGVIESGFTKRDAQLTFTWCRMHMVDEFSPRFGTISFTDFIEAIARVAAVKPFPSVSQLKEAGHSIDTVQDYMVAYRAKKEDWAKKTVLTAPGYQGLLTGMCGRKKSIVG